MIFRPRMERTMKVLKKNDNRRYHADLCSGSGKDEDLDIAESRNAEMNRNDIEKQIV